MTKLYLDYRTNEIVENLDTRTLALEEWIELAVVNNWHGMYCYTYQRAFQRMNITFTEDHIVNHPDGLWGYIYDILEAKDFTNAKLIRRVKYVSQEDLDQRRKVVSHRL